MRIRTTVNPDDFAAQYQQRPVPLGEAMFKRDWFRYYDDKPNPSKGYVIQSWDTAAKNGAQNDWSGASFTGSTRRILTATYRWRHLPSNWRVIDPCCAHLSLLWLW